MTCFPSGTVWCIVSLGMNNRHPVDMLTEMECDLMQCYFLSRPVAAADLTMWLQGKEPGSPSTE